MTQRISIHAPHEGERRPDPGAAGVRHGDFNPRSPRGGATWPTWASWWSAWNFNPRSPRGGATPPDRRRSASVSHFNPRSPRGGATAYAAHQCADHVDFNPRSPRGGATFMIGRQGSMESISIHAPHEGERQRKSAFVCSISANLLNIIHCGTVTRAVSRRRIALFRLFSVRRSGVFTYAYASH